MKKKPIARRWTLSSGKSGKTRAGTSPGVIARTNTLIPVLRSVITFYPHLDGLQHPLSGLLAKCWVYFNLYLAPF
ncbi:hypothetical protein FCI58_31430, partial [Enterobacter hormaechei]|nr:hypothetical protein [Enterobacter hormaechei]